MSIPGFAVRHDVDGDAVLHLRHRGHANVWQHCAQSKHRDRETQQLPAHRTSFHDAFQVRYCTNKFKTMIEKKNERNKQKERKNKRKLKGCQP